MNIEKIKEIYNKYGFWTIIIFLFIYCIFCYYPQIRHFYINVDGISYFSIAKKYANFNFYDAINGYWSPLISWLIAPFLFFGADALTVFKIINITASFFVVYFAKLILEHINCKYRYYNIIPLISITLLTMQFSLSLVTPDILSLLLLIIFVYFVIEDKIIKNPILIGILGAFAYFAKAYCFYIILFYLLFLLFSEIIIKRFSIKYIVKKYAIILSVFIIISSIWIGLIYAKYNYLTVSTSQFYNKNVCDKYITDVWRNEFAPPPNRTAVFVWEDIMFSFINREKYKPNKLFKEAVKEYKINYFKNSNDFIDIVKKNNNGKFFIFIFFTIFLFSFLKLSPLRQLFLLHF